jgi:hypothetical protein
MVVIDRQFPSSLAADRLEAQGLPVAIDSAHRYEGSMDSTGLRQASFGRGDHERQHHDG